jgi:hypothetical protein
MQILHTLCKYCIGLMQILHRYNKERVNKKSKQEGDAKIYNNLQS